MILTIVILFNNLSAVQLVVRKGHCASTCPLFFHSVHKTQIIMTYANICTYTQLISMKIFYRRLHIFRDLQRSYHVSTIHTSHCKSACNFRCCFHFGRPSRATTRRCLSLPASPLPERHAESLAAARMAAAGWGSIFDFLLLSSLPPPDSPTWDVTAM